LTIFPRFLGHCRTDEALSAQQSLVDEHTPEQSPLDGPYRPMIVAPDGTLDDPSLLLNWASDDEPSYRYGFYQAAYTIAVGMVNGTGPRSEALAYPMLWCFRQFVELSCKRIIRIGLELDMFDDTLDAASALSRHDLHSLWELAKPVLESVSLGDIESALFRRVNDIVAELQHLDPLSTAFRYATTLGGTPSLGSKMLVLRVNRLVENMDVAMNWLSEMIQMLQRRTC